MELFYGLLPPLRHLCQGPGVGLGWGQRQAAFPGSPLSQLGPRPSDRRLGVRGSAPVLLARGELGAFWSTSWRWGRISLTFGNEFSGLLE